MAKKKTNIIPKDAVKAFPKKEPYISPDDKEEAITEQTVIGINKAEALQKSGWQLISAVQVEKDEQGMTIKEYKFKKE